MDTLISSLILRLWRVRQGGWHAQEGGHQQLPRLTHNCLSFPTKSLGTGGGCLASSLWPVPIVEAEVCSGGWSPRSCHLQAVWPLVSYLTSLYLVSHREAVAVAERW